MKKNTKPNLIAFKISDYQRPGVSSDQIAELKEAFDLFDVHGAGSVNTKQLKAIMVSQGFEQENPTLFRFINDLSGSNTSSLDFTAFIDVMTINSGAKVTKKIAKKIFSLFDDEQGGFVSANNLKRLAKQLNLQISQNQLQAMIEAADRDKDGLISQNDFYEIMNK